MSERWLKQLEEKWDDVREAVTRFSRLGAAERLAHALTSSDINECRTLLFRAWEDSPDTPWIHDEPGFGIICDLLSSELEERICCESE